MYMVEWAEREVELACKREKPDRKEGEWDYGCACYESALKAYKSLMEDGHSGMSFSLTVQILIRLMNDKPLTPIEDTDDVWSECDRTYKHLGKMYQCKRKSSLFKDVYPDGKVSYHDNDRVVAYDLDNPTCGWHNGFVCNLIHEMYPITMPYISEDKPFKVYQETFLTDIKNGDYDTMGILYCIKPDGTKEEINKYYKESGNSWEVITEAEYLERKAIADSM